MLESLGLANLWQNQGTTDIYLPTIKQRILDQYYPSWYSNINNSQRLSAYSRLKHSFNLEPYLDIIYDRKFKVAPTRVKLSSHRLEIERGHYFNIPAERKGSANFVRKICSKMSTTFCLSTRCIKIFEENSLKLISAAGQHLISSTD